MENKSVVTTQQKTSMKKLKLYGEKKEGGPREHVATVYVDENKKVIVEADDPKVKEDLLNEIYDPEAPNELSIFILRVPGPPEEEEKDLKEGTRRSWAIAQRPGDPKFLEAFWDWNVKSGKRFGGYLVYDREIIEK